MIQTVLSPQGIAEQTAIQKNQHINYIKVLPSLASARNAREFHYFVKMLVTVL